MTMHTPAADRLAAKIKAARSIGLWGVEMTTQEADTLIAETARLAAANPLDGMTPQDCALGAHPAWAIEGEKSLPCPWCALEQAHAERDQAQETARRATAPALGRAPVHFTMDGTASVCGRTLAMLPKGVEFTLAFDPNDDAIDCRACGLYLEGLRASAHTIAGSSR